MVIALPAAQYPLEGAVYKYLDVTAGAQDERGTRTSTRHSVASKLS